MWIKRRGKRRLPGYSLGWALSKGKPVSRGKGKRNAAGEGDTLTPPMNPPVIRQYGTSAAPITGEKVRSGGGGMNTVHGARCAGRRVSKVVWDETKRWTRAYGSVAVKCMETARRGTRAGRFVRLTRDEAEVVCFMVVSWGVCVAAMVVSGVITVGRELGIW